ncbi:MAG: prolyl oligopeptidase family serine peptidase [Cyclobacteriaceae bacterium]
MKHLIWILLFSYDFVFSQASDKIMPPNNLAVSSTVFGRKIYDLYRGLEDLKNSEAQAWINQKNQQAKQILTRSSIHKMFLHEINQWSNQATIRASVPVDNGVFSYTIRHLVETDEQQVLLYRHPLDSGTVLFGTNDIIDSDSSYYSIESINPSPDNRYIAVCGFANGNDWMEIRVFDRQLNRFTSEVIDASLSYYPFWLPNSRSFLYTQLSMPDDTTDWFDHVRVKHHQLNTEQQTDRFILDQDRFESLPYQAGDFPTIQILPDSATARCSVAHGISQYLDYYVAPISDILSPNPPEQLWQELAPDQSIVNALFDEQFAYLLISTIDSTSQIIKIPLNSLQDRQILYTETDGYISEIEVRTEGLYMEVVRNGISELWLLQEELPRHIDLPFPGDISLTAEAYQSKVNGKGIYFGLSSWSQEYGIYYYNPVKDKIQRTPIRPKGIPVGTLDLAVEEVLVPSHDSVMVPLTIIYQKGTEITGKNPLILETYGAYGLSLEPYLETDLFPWYQRGGIVAKAHIRGGGEKGPFWHNQGRKEQKPNSWKDLLACAEFLIHNGFTTASRLGVNSNSAGGIAVGMALNKRPELFGAAVLEYPFLNPTRLAVSQDGEVHYEEFGNPEDSVEFNYLFQIDPYLHLAKKDYPPVLLSGGEGDTRVEIWEPAKYAAKLQTIRTNEEATLLRIYEGGHGVMSASELTNQLADKLTFFWSQLVQNSVDDIRNQ